MSRRPRHRPVRPLLDRLEPRDCPAVVVAQERNVLHLTGDEADDVVVVADQGGHAVRVQTGGVARTFTGVSRIVADLAGGADTFEFHQAERPTESLRLRVDLGAGDDRFVYPEPPAGSPPPDPDAPTQYAFDLRAGAGNDVMVIQPCIVPGLGFDVRADLGDGDNTFDASFRPDLTAPPRTSIPGISVAVAGGDGADTVRVAVGDPEQVSGIAMQKVRIGIDTGGGSDSGIIIICNVAVPGRLTQAINLGPGDDTATLTLDTVTVGGGVKQVVSGGDGGNVVGFVIYGSEVTALSQSVNGGDGGDQVGIIIHGRLGSLGQVVDLGAGDDMVRLTLSNPNELTAATLKQAQVRIDTGDGADTAAVTFGQVTVSGSAVVALDTGAGNDTSTVLLRDIDLAGRLRAVVATGDGDDRVSARAERTLFLGPARLGMTVRGGAGTDVLDLAMVDPTGHQYRGGRAGTAVAVAGGDGADRISIQTGALTLPPDPELRLDWHVAAFGGGGDDQIDVVGRDMILTGARVALDGGDGADRLAARFDGSTLIGAADFAVAIDGGEGSDTISFHWGVSQTGPGTLSVNLLGRGGDDDLTAAVATGPNGNLVTTLRMLAGAGDDGLSMDLLGGPDTVEDPNRVVLDGGIGVDSAHGPPGAVVRNCGLRL